MTEHIQDLISPEEAHTLPGLFRLRVSRSPARVAYRHFDSRQGAWQDLSWHYMQQQVNRWQTAMLAEGLQAGDRVGIMLRNCPQWVMFEQAALGLGLVVVPLYTNDRAQNLGYIIEDAGIRLLLIEDAGHWAILEQAYTQLEGVQTIVTLEAIAASHDMRLRHAENWLPAEGDELEQATIDPQSLATIVYTSGTTGNPKGVMLSHRNILWNASAAAACEPFYIDDLFLSFLPLSHMFERTAGYYLPMLVGATIAYARSIEQLADDLQQIRPTILITVPRIFERVYNKIKLQLANKPAIARLLFDAAVRTGWQRFLYQQGRARWSPQLLLWPLLNKLVASKIMAKLGGRLRLAVSGGAPLSPEIARTFIGLGLTISQGYGMTELSPVVSTNRLADNEPASVGQPLPDVEVRIGDNNELLVRSPGVMLGYWNKPEATAEIIDADGWVHTGDQARIERDHIYITGRLKEIIVLANGEKVPPADMEVAISTDPLFEQVMIVGEGRPFLSALVVLNREEWQALATKHGLPPDESRLNEPEAEQLFLARINARISHFPGYARIYKVHATLQPWTIEEGLLTPTLKLRRAPLLEKYHAVIEQLYAGH